MTFKADLDGSLFENPERRYDAKYSEFCKDPILELILQVTGPKLGARNVIIVRRLLGRGFF